MKLTRTIVVLTLILASVAPAHAGKMAKANGPILVPPDKAAIVFMRPGKFLSRAVAVPVFEVTNGEVQFVGIVDAGGKLGYLVAPGEHVFMTTIFGGDTLVRFQKAQVLAGKTYYFRAHMIQGLWTLDPIRSSVLESDEFAKWNRNTAWITNSPATLAWGEANLADAERKSSLEPVRIPKAFTLRTEDGR